MTQAEVPAWRELPVEITAEELGHLTAGLRAPVAVTGATGFVGSHLAAALVRAGVRPRLLVRDPRRLVPELAGQADLVAGSLGDDAALAAGGRVRHGVPRRRRRARRRRGGVRSGEPPGTERLVAWCPSRRYGFVHVSSLAAAVES
jgi:uncharacterized protein YbjT (DUF2867 family)